MVWLDESPRALLCLNDLTIKHGDNCLSQCQNQAQGRTEQEKVRHFKVKLPQGASVQHGAAAGPAGCCVFAQDAGVQTTRTAPSHSRPWTSRQRLTGNSCLPAANAPGEEVLVLLDGVQFVGGGVASFARQLLLGVIAYAGTRDVDVAPAEVAAALQGRRG